mmetsp:Transcript_24211/g.69800  ORF Transcript_24211/g.69800 Transcript_24211/m.69800 type:complete len:216 (-) Transcript_24211:299-946(-)
MSDSDAPAADALELPSWPAPHRYEPDIDPEAAALGLYGGRLTDIRAADRLVPLGTLSSGGEGRLADDGEDALGAKSCCCCCCVGVLVLLAFFLCVTVMNWSSSSMPSAHTTVDGTLGCPSLLSGVDFAGCSPSDVSSFAATVSTRSDASQPSWSTGATGDRPDEVLAPPGLVLPLPLPFFFLLPAFLFFLAVVVVVAGVGAVEGVSSNSASIAFS